MDSRSSPFDLGWLSAGSHPEFWSDDAATYSFVPYEDLPSIEPGLDGTFSWLQAAPQGDFALAFEDVAVAPKNKLARLAGETARRQLSMPDPFVKFISEPQLHKRVPTCTACYLDLPERLVEAPAGGGGQLLRFMNDQQSVLFWYLYLRPGGEHAVVVATPEFDDDERGDTIEDVTRLTSILFCAASFEEFIRRFWLENTIWFALHEGRRMNAEQTQYLQAVRAKRKIRRG